MTSSRRDDPDQLADELEREVDQLQRHAEEVGARTQAAREDWERKRRDDSVPGAPPPEGEPAEPPADQLEEGDD